jgi:hypothetical protein
VCDVGRNQVASESQDTEMGQHKSNTENTDIVMDEEPSSQHEVWHPRLHHLSRRIIEKALPAAAALASATASHTSATTPTSAVSVAGPISGAAAAAAAAFAPTSAVSR